MVTIIRHLHVHVVQAKYIQQEETLLYLMMMSNKIFCGEIISFCKLISLEYQIMIR